jgi:alpha-L-fucosidase
MKARSEAGHFNFMTVRTNRPIVTALLLFCLLSCQFIVLAQTFEPTWNSLKQYRTPEWFRDAKFGIWAHWGPQCQPEQGDWYGRIMYEEGSRQYNYQVANNGHPSRFGFKDVINQWKAENWDPEKLVALYKRAGAQYFFALANHHDNFDLWDSKHQPWNSLRIGPKKDLIAGWEKAARKNGLKFGVSVHASHTWTWYETAQRADKTGPFAGVAYDGNLTRASGKGLWWDGLDPQDLYAQRHPLSLDPKTSKTEFSQWEWGSGASQPSAEYQEKYLNRTIDLIDRYHPDLIYFDDTVLPFYPISDTGLRIASHFYNENLKRNGRLNNGVLFGKGLNQEQRKMMTWDIERGRAREIQPEPWQTDTCIGDWHYRRSLYDEHKYKTAATVIRMLADIVSKNGNLLLNIPVRGDGTIDPDEVAIVSDIAKWMDVNRESIFGTRPWKVFGEGPASETAPLTGPGFNEGKGRAFSEEDVRFTTKDNILYAIVLGVLSKPLNVRSLGTRAGLLTGKIENVALLGSREKVDWAQSEEYLTIRPVRTKQRVEATVFKILTRR